MLLDALERRVLAMVGALREARAARSSAEAEAAALREQLIEREAEIAQLKKRIEQDDLRAVVRERVQSLLRRVDELEQEGRSQCPPDGTSK